MKALGAGPKLDIAQVQVNGNTACNICGDKAAATITGDRAGQCTNDQSKCTIETVPTPDGSPMPKWISQVRFFPTGLLHKIRSTTDRCVRDGPWVPACPPSHLYPSPLSVSPCPRWWRAARPS